MRHVRRIGIATAIAVAVAGALVASRRHDTVYSISHQPDPRSAATVDAVGPLSAAATDPPVAQSPSPVPSAVPTSPTPTAEDTDEPTPTESGAQADQGDDSAAGGPQTTDGHPGRGKGHGKHGRHRSASLSPAEKKLLDDMNDERAEAGCDPLRADRALSRSAQRHSTDMSKRGFLSTQDPDGTGPAERAGAEGFHGTVAENIAQDADNASGALSSWLKNGGAKSNILECKTQSVGIGVERAASGISYWTADFGTP
jgi:uncharacterized protein YkwD